MGGSHVPWSAQRSLIHVGREAGPLRRLVAGVGPEIVHLHSSKAGLAGRLALRGSVPTVFQPHGWSFYATPFTLTKAAQHWERLASRWTDRILCVSMEELEDGVRSGIPRSVLSYTPNGVDAALFPVPTPAEIARSKIALGITTPYTVLCVGRVCKQKGQDVLLDAWARVVERFPEAGLILVGDGPSRANLERRGVPSVRFVGMQSDVWSWLAIADLVVFPSRWEGASLGVMEALCAKARSDE